MSAAITSRVEKKDPARWIRLCLPALAVLGGMHGGSSAHSTASASLPVDLQGSLPFKWRVAVWTLSAPCVKTVLSYELGTAALNLHGELNESLICCGSS